MLTRVLKGLRYFYPEQPISQLRGALFKFDGSPDPGNAGGGKKEYLLSSG